MSDVLLTHEWLAKAGGSENVFEQISVAFPEAEQYCLWNDDPRRFPDVSETWLARTPLRRHKPIALPLLRSALRSIPLENYETVIASSHAFGHYNAYRAASAGKRGFAYVHSPARYIWSPEYDSRGDQRLARTVAAPMKFLDRRTTGNGVHYAANSNFVRLRIRKAWGVEARVIHPPVAVDEIVAQMALPMSDHDSNILNALPSSFLLGASRLIPYKRIDQVIRLAKSMDLPLVIAGEGPERENLQRTATTEGVRAHFVGRVSNRLLYELFRTCTLYVFLAVEDFGIMPLEAVAAGSAVLVNQAGGAWEGVARSDAGERCDLTDWNSVVSAARRAIELKDEAGPQAVQQFSNSSFRRNLRKWIDEEPG